MAGHLVYILTSCFDRLLYRRPDLRVAVFERSSDITVPRGAALDVLPNGLHALQVCVRGHGVAAASARCCAAGQGRCWNWVLACAAHGKSGTAPQHYAPAQSCACCLPPCDWMTPGVTATTAAPTFCRPSTRPCDRGCRRWTPSTSAARCSPPRAL